MLTDWQPRAGTSNQNLSTVCFSDTLWIFTKTEFFYNNLLDPVRRSFIIRMIYLLLHLNIRPSVKGVDISHNDLEKQMRAIGKRLL